MKNFEQYRLNSITEIDELVARIGAEKFYQYRESVFDILRKLQPGNTYDIAGSIRPENLPVFIKCACLYIYRTGGDCNIVFSDDYTRIKGIQSFDDGRREMQEYQKQVKKRCPNEKK